MRKLNQRKIRWICREMKKGELSVCRIAKLQTITPRHARRVYEKYRGVKRPKLLPCGRKPEPIAEEEVELIIAARKEHPVGAVNLEKILGSKGEHIPHNRIHKVLLQYGLARADPKKQKRRRPWVRYERRHSNSLWHADWFERDEEQIVLFEDDASRLLTGFGSFSNATAENAKTVLEEAIGEYGSPQQLITDHGVQFTSFPRETCPNPEPNAFQRFLSEKGIQHIKARVKHPQSNGKVERLFQTLYGLKSHWKSWGRTIEYYSFERPHMSLENSKLRTPHRAFMDKVRKN
jgi:putative transposase